MTEMETTMQRDKLIDISAYLVDILKDNLAPHKAIEALVGALIMVHRTSNIHVDIKQIAETIRRLIIQMDKEIASGLMN